LPAKGAKMFLIAIGFKETIETIDDSQQSESFLVISEESANNGDHMQQALDMLLGGEPVPLQLYRNASVCV
jgi:hypothetical protein